MSSSKRDFETVQKVVLDAIKSLSDFEYENLLIGKGTLKYVEKRMPIELKEEYEGLIYKLSLLNSEEEIWETIKNEKLLDSKFKLLEFLNYFNITVRTKDTIDTLCSKLKDYILQKRDLLLNSHRQNVEHSDNIENISEELQRFNDSKSAVSFLDNHKLLSTKSNLIKLAKKLDVYIEKDLNSEEIIKRIVDAVVVSKLRSATIRNDKDGI